MRNFPNKYVIAVIPFQPLPSAPKFSGNTKVIIDRAIQDFELYKACGVDSILFTNDYDYPQSPDPISEQDIEVINSVLKYARENFNLPIGLKIKEEQNELTLRIANELDLDFIRVGNFVYSYISSSGIVNGCAHKLLRLRKSLRCEHIKIFADVKRKEVSHFITSDLSFKDRVKETEKALADGLIVTSTESGTAPNGDISRSVKDISKLPVIIGSGVDISNIENFIDISDGFIIGTSFRKDGKFDNEPDKSRVEMFMNKFNELRKSI